LLLPQHINYASDITKLVLEMSNSNLSVKIALNRQKIFKDQEDKKDPENPVYVPKLMKVKTSISHPKECEGDPIMVELQEKQTALNKEYQIRAGQNCSAAATRSLEIACTLRLETFATNTIDLFETITSYHSFIVHPDTCDPQQFRFLMTKILVALIRAALPSEDLENEYFT